MTLNRGQPFDGVCPTVGTVVRGLKHPTERGDILVTVDGAREWQHVIICVGKAGGEWVYDSHTVAHRRRPLAVWYPAHFSLIRYCHIAGSVAYD